MKKPITQDEALPRPWTISESNGGKLLIYDALNRCVEMVKPKKRMTRKELATLTLICSAVNYFEKQHMQFQSFRVPRTKR